MGDTFETIRLKVVATEAKLSGIIALEGRLKSTANAVDALERRLKGLGKSPFAGQSTGTLQQALVLGKNARSLTPDVVAQILGLPKGSELNAALAAWKAKLGAAWNQNFKSGAFESSLAAANFGKFALRNQINWTKFLFGQDVAAGFQAGSSGPAGTAFRRVPAAGAGGGRPANAAQSTYAQSRLDILTELEKARATKNLDSRAAAAGYRKAADALDALAAMSGLPEVKVKKSELESARLRRQAQALQDRADVGEQKEFGNRMSKAANERLRDEVEQARRNIRARQLRRQRADARNPYLAEGEISAGIGQSEAEYRAALARAAQQRDAYLNQQGRAINNLAAQRRNRQAAVLSAGTPPPIPPPPPGPTGLGRLGLLGQFIGNTAKVTMWASSVAALYKTVELAEHGLASLIETGSRMARLDQVFSHVGGSTKELTDDVLSLASATGRTTKEAMESAIQWARFGLSRSQVAEAVRVSLLAANVAEISAADATEKLSGIMAGYQLNVRGVAVELGELNAISNTANVTVAAMLEGLSRVTAVARSSGVSLSELNAIIGITSARTGQSAANIGNAFKTILARYANPDIQKKLRYLFNIEAESAPGQLKPGSEMLRDVFLRYQELNKKQREFLSYTQGGATQINRVAAVFENYVDTQVKAIQAQQNINSAQIENAKITDTVKSKLAGLTAEWERLINLGGSGVTGSLKTGLDSLSGILRVINAIQSAPLMQKGLGRILPGFSSILPTGLRSILPLAAGGLSSLAQRDPAAFGQADIARKNADAALQTAQLIETAMRALPHALPENLRPLLAGVQKVTEGGPDLEYLAKVGDKQRLLIALETLRNQKIRESGRERVKAEVLAKQAVGDAERQLDEYNDSLLTRFGLRGAKGREQMEKEVADARKRAQNPIDEREYDFEAHAEQDVRHMAVLERQKQTLEAIGAIYHSIRAVSPIDQFNLELAALEAQKKSLSDQYTLMKARFGYKPTGNEGVQIQETAKQLEGIIARISGLESTRDLANFNERFQRGQRRAGLDLLPFSVGETETDRLLAERNRLRAVTRGGGAGGPEDQGRHAANLEMLEKNILDIETRRARVHQDIRQYAIDTNREFRASLLGAGPADLLRKMAAFNISKGAISPGQFMALSPALRGDLGLLRPDFTARGIELNRESRLLDPNEGHRQTYNRVLREREGIERRFRQGGLSREEYENQVETNAAEAAAIRRIMKNNAANPDAGVDKQLDEVQAAMAKFAKLIQLPPIPKEFLDSTAQAALELQRLTTAANAAAAALNQLPAIIDQLNANRGGAGNFVAPLNPGMMGLNAGAPAGQ
jgi:TP901 family phage tail tape measure protein